VKGVAVCLVHTTLIWHQRYSQLWHRAVWQICTNISEYLLPPSSGWWRQQVPLRHVTYLPAYSGWTKVMSNIIITTLREPQISIYMTLSKSLKSRPKS